MDLSALIVKVFCIIDDLLADKKLRQREPQPRLNDSEVLTIELDPAFSILDSFPVPLAFCRTHLVMKTCTLRPFQNRSGHS